MEYIAVKSGRYTPGIRENIWRRFTQEIYSCVRNTPIESFLNQKLNVILATLAQHMPEWFAYVDQEGVVLPHSHHLEALVLAKQQNGYVKVDTEHLVDK